jgi:membrane-bound ClpP family serine protease
MENSFNINEKRIKANEILQIIKEHKERSNKDLKLAMDFIQEDFNMTKESLIKLTHHLDKLENTYNILHKEYTNRNKTI